MASIAITEATPNTTPSAVRKERNLWSQIVFSPSETVRHRCCGERTSLRMGWLMKDTVEC